MRRPRVRRWPTAPARTGARPFSRSSISSIFISRCSAIRSEAASIRRPSRDTAPRPSSAASCIASMMRLVRETRRSLGEKTSLASSIWLGMDAPLALEPEDRGPAGGDQVALRVAEVAEGPVDRPQPVRPARDGDARQGVMPLIAPVQFPLGLVVPVRVGDDRVVRIRAADRGGLALDRGRVVGDAEDQGLHPLGAARGDLVEVDHPGRRLDQRRDPDRLLDARSRPRSGSGGSRPGGCRPRSSPSGRGRCRATRRSARRRRRCRGSSSACPAR